jgi:hypothetical protein
MEIRLDNGVVLDTNANGEYEIIKNDDNLELNGTHKTVDGHEVIIDNNKIINIIELISSIFLLLVKLFGK